MRNQNVFNNKRSYKAVTSIIATIAFLCTTLGRDISWATENDLQAGKSLLIYNQVNNSLNSDVSFFRIPAKLGEIQDSWAPEDEVSCRKTIIHIQDAHCNYAAQKKISEIIGYFNNEYGVNIVNLEGGEENYDFSPFTDIADEVLRQKVSDYFVRQGVVNGAEYFAINNPDKIRLWGVENTELYLKNLTIYRKSLAHKENINKQLQSLSDTLDKLKRRMYSEELLEFDRTYAAYRDAESKLKDYLAHLIKKSEALGIAYDKFENIVRLYHSLTQEEKIDFERANIERNKLIDALQKILSKLELKEVALKTIGFNQGKIKQKEFYEFLIKRTKSTNIDLSVFPELKKYTEYISLYENLNKTKMVEELDSFGKEVKEALCQNDAERQLNYLSEHLVLVKKLFNMTLTRREYECYKNNEKLFSIKKYLSFVNREMPLYNIATEFPDGLQNLDTYLAKMSEFYEYSFKRDRTFLKNLKFSDDVQKPTILITGGFHSENIYKLFKERNISYISIIPNFKNEDEYKCPYHNLISGSVLNIFKPVALSTSMLAVYSYLCGEKTQKIHNLAPAGMNSAVNLAAGLLEGDKAHVSQISSDTKTGKKVITLEKEIETLISDIFYNLYDPKNVKGGVDTRETILEKVVDEAYLSGDARHEELILAMKKQNDLLLRYPEILEALSLPSSARDFFKKSGILVNMESEEYTKLVIELLSNLSSNQLKGILCFKTSPEVNKNATLGNCITHDRFSVITLMPDKSVLPFAVMHEIGHHALLALPDEAIKKLFNLYLDQFTPLTSRAAEIALEEKHIVGFFETVADFYALWIMDPSFVMDTVKGVEKSGDTNAVKLYDELIKTLFSKNGKAVKPYISLDENGEKVLDEKKEYVEDVLNARNVLGKKLTRIIGKVWQKQGYYTSSSGEIVIELNSEDKRIGKEELIRLGVRGIPILEKRTEAEHKILMSFVTITPSVEFAKKLFLEFFSKEMKEKKKSEELTIRKVPKILAEKRSGLGNENSNKRGPSDFTKRIVNELKPGAQTKILSLCALDLTNEIFLAKQGSQVLAIGNNLNERQADIEKYSNLTAINGDIRTEVEKLKGYFDIIIVENGLHYLDRSDLEKVFKHISRLLVQEKGHLCFVVRSKKDWQYLETIDRGETEDSFSWLTKYYDSQVNKYFSRQFFDKKRIEYYLELKGVSLKLKELSEVEQPLSQTVDLSLGEDRKPFVLLEGIIVKLPLTRKKISQRIDEGVNNVDEVLTTEEKRKKGSLKDIIATLIKTAANILRQENTSVNTFLIVQDECFVKEADASRNAELAGIVSKVGRVFGHKRGNHVHICKSYQSAKEKLDKISNVDWKNTFLYVDSRVDDKEVWDQDECNAKKVFDGFIKVELKTGLDGSILMAAPISGYAAYSQVYSDLIERIEILCKEEESAVITQHIVSLVKAMAIIQKTIVQSDDSVETIENEIMKISDGIIKIANEIDSKNKMDLIKDFLKEYRKQHVWDLPYIKAIDWQEVVKRVKLEEKTIYFL